MGRKTAPNCSRDACALTKNLIQPVLLAAVAGQNCGIIKSQQVVDIQA